MGRWAPKFEGARHELRVRPRICGEGVTPRHAAEGHIPCRTRAFSRWAGVRRHTAVDMVLTVGLLLMLGGTAALLYWGGQ